MSSVSHFQSTAILVLGMHRSGTSAATRVVNLLGAHLGSDVLPPADDNPGGFWEHLGAYQIHERLLKALGRNWYSVTAMPENWLAHPASIQAQNEIEDLIRTEFLGFPLWAIKDPRMCRLAPLWLRAAGRLGVAAKALIVLREPREVAESLKSRDGWLYGHSYLMWTQHLIEAEVATRGICRTLITYDSLTRDWQSCMEKAGGELDVKWPVDRPAIVSQVSAYIDPVQHRHHSATQLGSRPDIPAPPHLVAQLYQEGCQIQAGDADWVSLQNYERQYDAAANMFALAVTELEGKTDKYAADIQIWRAEAEACGARLEDAVNRGNELQAAIGQAESNVSQLTDRVAALDLEIRHLQAEGRALQRDLSEQRSMFLQSENSRDALGLRVESLERHNAGLRAALELLETKHRSRKWLLKRLLRLQGS